MLSQRIGFLQYQPPLSKVQLLFSVAAYLQKVVDIKIVDATITQQLSNSATQQLSNSATQQLSNSATQQLSNSATRLCPDKRAIFSFKQHHYYFFSSIFADGKRTVRLFYFKPQRALSMRRKIERRVDKDIPSKTLAFSASFVGALRKRTAKHIPYSQDSSINFVPHNYTLCIINYPLFSAFYRRSRPAVWFDSG